MKTKLFLLFSFLSITLFAQIPNNQKQWFANTVLLDSTTRLYVGTVQSGQIIKDVLGNGTMTWVMPDYLDSLWVKTDSICYSNGITNYCLYLSSGGGPGGNFVDSVYQNGDSVCYNIASNTYCFLNKSFGVDSIYRKAGIDSIFYRKNNIEYGIKDSVGGGGSAAGITGMVQFNNAAAFAADSNFRWDNANKRLGLREFTPAATLDIRSSTNTSLSTALRVGGSSNNDYFFVRGDGFVGIKTNTPVLANTALAVGNPTQNQDVMTINSTTSGLIGAQVSFWNGATRLGNIRGITILNRRGISITADLTNGRGIYTSEQNGRTLIGFSTSEINVSPAIGTLLTSGGASTTDMLTVAGSNINLFNENNVIGAGGAYRTYLLDASNNLKLSTEYRTSKFNNNAATFTTVASFHTIINNTLGERFRISETGSILVNTTTDVPSSILTLESTTKGFLPPRMTTAQRDSIVSPANGLFLYTTTDSSLNYRTGNLWNTISSGIYTPTLTGINNITSSTAYPCMYDVVGKKVNVSCQVGVEITSTGDYQIDISLPIPSDFTNVYDCIGLGSSDSKNEYPQYIDADTTNNRARVHGSDNDATLHNHFINFSYYIK